MSGSESHAIEDHDGNPTGSSDPGPRSMKVSRTGVVLKMKGVEGVGKYSEGVIRVKGDVSSPHSYRR